MHSGAQPDSPIPACAQQEQQFARAFSILREAIAQRAFPGAALAVTHRGALVASQGFGRFTYDANSPEVRADTVFDLASLTKVLGTTAMAMLLYERGVLSLDEPLAADAAGILTCARGSAVATGGYDSYVAGARQRTARVRKAVSAGRDARGADSRRPEHVR